MKLGVAASQRAYQLQWREQGDHSACEHMGKYCAIREAGACRVKMSLLAEVLAEAAETKAHRVEDERGP
jgi:hypothetical protein